MFHRKDTPDYLNFAYYRRVESPSGSKRPMETPGTPWEVCFAAGWRPAG